MVAVVAEDNGAPRAVRLAGLVAAAEGAGVLIAAAVLGVSTLLERPDSYGRALFAMAIGLAAGVLLLGIGRGVFRVQGWARAPVIVAQVLLIPVGYTLAFTAGLPLYGVPILALCVAEFFLLLTPQARQAYLDR
ncbi:MAG: hypothetical protein H0V64_12960 [Geodermatophilaceae bacterium]|nr:hypothetical protein [Geodermatophilaceae bacterium]